MTKSFYRCMPEHKIEHLSTKFHENRAIRYFLIPLTNGQNNSFLHMVIVVYVGLVINTEYFFGADWKASMNVWSDLDLLLFFHQARSSFFVTYNKDRYHISISYTVCFSSSDIFCSTLSTSHSMHNGTKHIISLSTHILHDPPSPFSNRHHRTASYNIAVILKLPEVEKLRILSWMCLPTPSSW